MFTGIIQDFGEIKFIKNGLYEILTNLDLTDCSEGSSISCNGVCLTARNIKKNIHGLFSLDVNIGEETLSRTNLRETILENKKINLEKSLKIGDEIGGHFVYGHVDCITNLIKIVKLKNSWEYYFEKKFDQNNKFITEKASISINGVSLTIANVKNESFIISVIEHTHINTNLKYLKDGDNVNIEFDYLARFIFKNE